MVTDFLAWQPSQVGIELDTISFNNFFGDTNIGPVASNGSFALSAQSTINLGLVGRLIPQDSQSGLDAVSTVFNRFILGLDSDIAVHGQNAGPSDVWHFALMRYDSLLMVCSGKT